MIEQIKEKILYLSDLVKKVRELRSGGKVVVQSHGIFDIIHPGILKHLDDAKESGDILIVTVVKDKDVRKGPGRPVFPENYRLQNAASLQQVDYVALVDDNVPFSCVKEIKPDIFARGQSYARRDRKIHSRIFEEERELYFGKCRILETEGFSFSSSGIINNFLHIYPEETKRYLKEFAGRYSFNRIMDAINGLRDLKVLLIGDGIIDEYFYCESMGKSPKAQLIVHKYLSHEVFAGGVFAIANHVASICGKVHMVTMLGMEDSREDFVRGCLKPNVEAKFFYRDDGPTIVKRRYISNYQNHKIFEVNFINDSYVDDFEIIKYLKDIIDGYDLVLISDFGHGIITADMIGALGGARKLAVNAQTNGANAGYNLITKYKNPGYICLDVSEARLAAQDKFSAIDDVAKKLTASIACRKLMITVGGDGSICVNDNGEVVKTPAFATKVVDIVGAGDAFFAYTAPCFARDMPTDMLSFIGNAAGALAVQIMGNKKTVEKHELLEFMHTILK